MLDHPVDTPHRPGPPKRPHGRVVEELGVHHDILVVHPEQARQLRTAYAEGLDDMLASAGFTTGMFSNPRVPIGLAFVAQKGMVGTVGFESAGLVVEVYDGGAGQ